MTTKNTLRVAIYARVSKDEGMEVENQLRELRLYCERHGWTIHREYVDHITGSKSNRLRFVEMMKDARLHRFDLLLFWSLDRFTREGTFKTLSYLKQLDAYKMPYRSHEEEYIDTLGPWKDAVVGIIAAIASMERQRIGERTKAALALRRERGQVLGRAKARNDDKLVADVTRMRAEGVSIRKMADALEKSPTTILRLMKWMDARSTKVA